ncbi:hypothetical protein EXIGLDRAFT_830140 [Exidia glandulosa HHB12029]|uniref:Uncharacterized protein n=1 Tax=Exidia glandulosa HHB12029 TaxID=1314781 RepID=A0A165NZI7_EXIGL|nr:hypothetical protein EXIGLDRAFT_830140 [Exidia glandulosa HHB12029]
MVLSNGDAAVTEVMQTLQLTVNRILEPAIPCDASDDRLPLMARSVHEYVASLSAPWLRKYNVLYSRQHVFPDEIWCAIWNETDLNTRVAVIHVCAHWRRLALETSTLWARLNIGPWFFRQEDSTGDSQVVLMRILSLSSSHPLSITIHQPDQASAELFATFLAACLDDQRHRIVALRLTGLGHFLCHELVKRLLVMPVLKFFTVEEGDWTSGYPWALSTQDDLDWPVLERLELSDDLRWPLPMYRANVTLPRARVLSMRFDSVDDITSAVTACPQLEDLHIRVSRHGITLDPSFSRTLCQGIDRIANVTIDRCTPALEHWYTGNFDHERHQQLFLQYDYATYPACTIFSGLQSPIIQISFNLAESDQLVIRARDFTNRKRQVTVTFDEAHAPGVMSNLAPQLLVQEVKRVIVDAPVLHAVGDTLWTPACDTLLLRVASQADVFILSGRGSMLGFTCVTTVWIQALEDNLVLPLDIADAFLRRIRGGNSVLKRLIIDGLALNGDPSNLNSFADSVIHRGEVVKTHSDMPAPRVEPECEDPNGELAAEVLNLRRPRNESP